MCFKLIIIWINITILFFEYFFNFIDSKFCYFYSYYFLNINENTPNFGAGLYFYKPNKYYLSVSVPNILESVHLDSNDFNIGSETRHLFAAVGYVFDLNNDFKL